MNLTLLEKEEIVGIAINYWRNGELLQKMDRKEPITVDPLDVWLLIKAEIISSKDNTINVHKFLPFLQEALLRMDDKEDQLH